MTSDTRPAQADPVDPVPSGTAATAKKPQPHSRIISSVLSPAIRLWMRSQLDAVDNLEFQVASSDRQLLAGQVQQVHVAAENAVYQGIHLTQARITAHEIRTNLRQVLRGKPLRLSQQFPVEGAVHLSKAALNRSLQASLLRTAIMDFLQTVVFPKLPTTVAAQLDGPVQPDQLLLTDGWMTLVLATPGRAVVGGIRARLELANPDTLRLCEPVWVASPAAETGEPLAHLDGLHVVLGEQVALEALHIAPHGIACHGKVWVTPET